MTTRQRLWLWILGLVPLIGLCVFLVGSSEPAGMPTGINGRTHTVVSTRTPPVLASTGIASSVPSGRAPATTVLPAAPEDMDVSALYQLLETQPASVAKITFVSGTATAIVHRVNAPDARVKLPAMGEQALADRAWKANVTFNAVAPPPDEYYLLKTVGPYVFPVVGFMIFFLVMKRFQAKAQDPAKLATQGGPDGKLAGLGKSKAKTFKAGEKKLTFDDIAGCDEAIMHMKRIARWQKRRKIYEMFGAKPPKGFLISGRPGVGKTLLARVLAHVIDGDIHITSGSDFEEMLVGVGASRARDLWGNAVIEFEKTGRTQIIVIDEIDAVGARRGTTMNGGHENTLNAILVEIDGVLEKAGIIVIGLTNRKDMLDPALTRPGRLEYNLTVDYPDVAGREAIGIIHTRDKKLAADVTPRMVAELTYDFSGADLAFLYNHAAMLAAERADEANTSEEEVLPDSTEICLQDIMKAIDFVQFGDEKVSKQNGMREQDKLNTLVHELGGHALVADDLKAFCDPVSKVTIMRRDKALGFVAFMPDHDRVSQSKEQCLANIIIAMAGRAAQEHYLGVVDSGARGDFEQGTKLARLMVMSWGMSNVGHISVGQQSDGSQITIGPDLQNRIDAEFCRIVEECWDASVKLVAANEPRFKVLAKELLEVETFNTQEWRKRMEEHPSVFEVSSVPMLNSTPKKLEL